MKLLSLQPSISWIRNRSSCPRWLEQKLLLIGSHGTEVLDDFIGTTLFTMVRQVNKVTAHMTQIAHANATRMHNSCTATDR